MFAQSRFVFCKNAKDKSQLDRSELFRFVSISMLYRMFA